MCQIWLANVKEEKSYGPDKKTRKKPFKFDLEVKGQRRICIINVRDTSSHGDRPICQIWQTNVKGKKSCGPETNLHRWTDRQIPIHSQGV